MRANSLEIFWNSKCIKEALTIVTTVDSSTLLQNPMVKKSMRAFASEASIYITQNINVSMEMDAPKIIIPESCGADKGCLVLDMGHFSLSGHKSVTDMNINMSLRSINANMPLKLDTIYGNDTSQYLVKPFDFNICVANAPTDITDLVISLDVLPGLRMETDIPKISRLLQVANIVTSAFPTKASKTPNVKELEEEELIPFRDQEQYDDLQSINQVSSSSKAISVIDPTRKTFELKFLNPVIKLDIYFTEYYFITMEMKNLQAKVIQRPYDEEYAFTMEAIYISDSMRYEKFRAIMWSTLTSYSDAIKNMDSKKYNESNNITISYINTKSKKSPYYNKHMREVSVIFSQLSLSVDVDSINRLIPYAETMAKVISNNSTSSGITTLAESDKNTRSITDTENIAQAAQSIGSINFKMTVDRVALELMHLTTIKATSRKIAPPNPFATPLKVPLPKEIEIAFTSVMSGLAISFDMTSDQISSNISLTDFSVSDKRSEFASYHYKEIICRSKLASEFSNPSVKKDYPSAMKWDEDNNLLTISFTQDGNPHPSNIIIDILLRDATALVTFGRTRELINLSNEIVNAGLLLSSKFSDKGNNSSPSSKRMSTTSISKPKTEKRDSVSNKMNRRRSTLTANEDINSYMMNVTVKIANPRILILENRSNENSKAIVMRSNICLLYTSDAADE